MPRSGLSQLFRSSQDHEPDDDVIDGDFDIPRRQQHRSTRSRDLMSRLLPDVDAVPEPMRSQRRVSGHQTSEQDPRRTALSSNSPRSYRNDLYDDRHYDFKRDSKPNDMSASVALRERDERQREIEAERQRSENRQRFSTSHHDPRRSLDSRRARDEILNVETRVHPADPKYALHGPRRKKFPDEDMEKYNPRDRNMPGWDH